MQFIGSSTNELEDMVQKVLVVAVSMHWQAASRCSRLQLPQAAAVSGDDFWVFNACEVNDLSSSLVSRPILSRFRIARPSKGFLP